MTGEVILGRLLTNPIFLARILDPDLIPHSNPLAFSGSPIRSDPIDLLIHLALKGPKRFLPGATRSYLV
jgi:hypothetical protein